jgi:hypothetical protein
MTVPALKRRTIFMLSLRDDSPHLTGFTELADYRRFRPKKWRLPPQGGGFQAHLAEQIGPSLTQSFILWLGIDLV